MDQRINRLEEKLDTKLDAIVDKLHELNITLIRNTDSLEVHEMRTDIAEKKLDLYEERLEKMEAQSKLQKLIFLKIIPTGAAIAVAVVTFLHKAGILSKFLS